MLHPQGLYHKLSLLGCEIYWTPGSPSPLCGVTTRSSGNGQPCSSKPSNCCLSHRALLITDPQKDSPFHARSPQVPGPSRLCWDGPQQRGLETPSSPAFRGSRCSLSCHLQTTQPPERKDDNKTAVPLDMQDTICLWNSSAASLAS